MGITKIPNYSCSSCIRLKNWGKRNCKKCNAFYTSEWKTNRLSYKQEKRIEKKQSPKELIAVYDWLRENVFPAGYVLGSDRVIFSYKKNGSSGAWCKGKGFDYKEIRIARHYQGKELYQTMLHEMLHMRLPHHRKSFKDKEKELNLILDVKYNNF